MNDITQWSFDRAQRQYDMQTDEPRHRNRTEKEQEMYEEEMERRADEFRDEQLIERLNNKQQ